MGHGVARGTHLITAVNGAASGTFTLEKWLS
jgi:hypothetical protein